MQDFSNYNPNSPSGYATRALSTEAVFFQRIYSWMFFGLALTAGVAFVLMGSQAWINFLVGSRAPMIVALVVQLGIVFFLSSRINSLAPSTAKILFLAYAGVTGATFSVIGLIYSPAAIFKAFVSTAGVYGAMAAYGLVTKRSLQAWGSFLFMGLVGLIIASVVNMFMQSGMMDFVICVIGVLIFAALTAYDHQKLRVIHATGLNGADDDAVSRVVIIGALNLYLDFINLFLFLLRLFGSSRD
jgi:FtsH-binding integral membrane protein